MKTINKYFGLLLLSGMVAGGLSSCGEEAFDADGEGVLRMSMRINSDVTRAETDYDALRSNCVLYISDSEGLKHKYVGLQNVPEAIHMKTGHYVAEAWTGDSVPASFDKKFFRGYQPFDVAKGENQVVINCAIANVVVSVNNATIDPAMLKDWTITVDNDGSPLTFDEGNVATEKAYFMMSSRNKDLTYTIQGTNAAGKAFTKTGTLPDVQRAHEYIFNLSYDPQAPEEGGAYITVVIDDTEIPVNSEVTILAAPAIKGSDFDIAKQITGEAGQFAADRMVKVSAFNGITSMQLSSADAQSMHLPSASFDLIQATEAAKQEINNAGITWDYQPAAGTNGVSTSFITLTKAFLNALPERDTEYRLDINVTDNQGRKSAAVLRIAVGENAIVIDDPVVVDPISENDCMAVLSHSATLNVTIADDTATGVAVEYRESGADTWMRQNVNPTRAVNSKVTLSGLKPGVRYEYRAVADGFTGESMFLTTETTFTIPNASMEEWSTLSTNSKVTIPAAGGTISFWDSGNHGSATMSKTLTTGSTDMFHSGTKAARLESLFVGIGFAGKFAAGNLFIGSYDKTAGTNGELTFGRPYDGSHPSAMKLWVNYRPKAGVKSKGGKDGYIAVGEMDKGQIYVALSTQPVSVKTADPENSLFNKDADCILAYGQYTFEGDFGADGALQELTIPITYYDRAKTNKPLYLIVVCSASIYGDYFSGGDGSLMYVDDFQLIYE